MKNGMKKFTIFSSITAVIVLAVFVELYSSGYITTADITGTIPNQVSSIDNFDNDFLQTNVLDINKTTNNNVSSKLEKTYKSFSMGATIPNDIDVVAKIKTKKVNTTANQDKSNNSDKKETKVSDEIKNNKTAEISNDIFEKNTVKDGDEKIDKNSINTAKLVRNNSNNDLKVETDPILNFEDILKEQLIERIEALPTKKNVKTEDEQLEKTENIEKIAKILSTNPKNRIPVDFEDIGYTFYTDVPITYEMILKSGLKHSTITQTEHNGLLFKTVNFSDLPGVSVKKSVIKSDDKMFAMIYEFKISQQTSSQNVFNALKTRLKNYLNSDYSINSVTSLGDEAFFFNDPARPNVAFLTLRFKNSIYAFSYPKENHPQILNLITLLSLEF